MPLRIGTSGYQYRHWRGVLYPPRLPERAWLAHYAAFFDTVELNATFYRLPTPATVDRWRDGVPAGFAFAVKGSRYLTHLKRLLDTDRGQERFREPISRFGDRLAVTLWQLPPQAFAPGSRTSSAGRARAGTPSSTSTTTWAARPCGTHWTS